MARLVGVQGVSLVARLVAVQFRSLQGDSLHSRLGQLPALGTISLIFARLSPLARLEGERNPHPLPLLLLDRLQLRGQLPPLALPLKFPSQLPPAPQQGDQLLDLAENQELTI